MLTVVNRERYALYRSQRDSQSVSALVLHELVLPALLLGSIGAIAWAIRGTSGWGGIDGTIVPGMMWGILWFYLCWRKGIACHGIPLWLGLGIALGGELGYGQYVSWIQGIFRFHDQILSIAPWKGWLWFLVCGIGWGAPGGVLLGWALSEKSSFLVWLGRLIIPVAVAALGWQMVHSFPATFFPNYELGIYVQPLDHHLERTVYTNTQNFTVAAWWLGCVLVAVIQRDKPARLMSIIIGGGFGFGFMFAAIWCLGYKWAPDYIDWWKVWELNAGFNLGILYTLALSWCVRQVDKVHDATGKAIISGSVPPSKRQSNRSWSVGIAFETLAVFGFVLAIFLEAEPFVSAAMGSLYVFFMAWLLISAARHFDPARASDTRGRLSFLYCVFLFLFVTFHGVSYTTGLVLKLYTPATVEQYDWPRNRILIFLPLAAATLLWTLRCMMHALLHRNHAVEPPPDRFPNRISDLMTGLAAAGAVSIWPSQIGILYALLLAAGIWAFNQMSLPSVAHRGAKASVALSEKSD